MGLSYVNLTLEQIGILPQEEMLEMGTTQKRLTVGMLKENNSNEYRVPLTPQGVEALADAGHRVIMESEAGLKANYSDLDYSEAGALITKDKRHVLESEIVLKVSPLSDEEVQMLKPNQTVLSAFNAMSQSSEKLIKLMQKKVNAIAFEYIRGENNHQPFVSTMSEIAGLLSINIAAEYLSSTQNGKGILLGGISGVPPTEIVILGTGTAAEFAARAAMGMGARVRVIGTSTYKLRRLQHHLQQPIFTSLTQTQILHKALKTADVVIGALDLSDPKDQFLISEDMVCGMKPGSVIIDISIDQGGCFETSRLTSHTDPVYEKHNILHYGVPNIASRVARTSSIALSNIISSIIQEISDNGGVRQMLRNDIGLRRGVYVYQGILTNSQVGKRFQLPSQNIDLLMAAI